MRVTNIFGRGTAILAASLVAASVLASGATAHTVETGEVSQTIPLPPQKTTQHTLDGNKFYTPGLDPGGTATLVMNFAGKTTDVIVSPAAAECDLGFNPILGVDVVSGGGTLEATLRIQGTTNDQDNNDVVIDETHATGKLGSAPGAKRDLYSLCQEA